MIDNKFVAKNNTMKSEIVNIEVSRIFIKKVFIPKNNPVDKNGNENKTIILQIAPDKGVFIDSKFVKTDNFTLNANIGIVLLYDYSIISLNEKNQKVEKVSGSDLITMINQFSEQINN